MSTPSPANKNPEINQPPNPGEMPLIHCLYEEAQAGNEVNALTPYVAAVDPATVHIPLPGYLTAKNIESVQISSENWQARLYVATHTQELGPSPTLDDVNAGMQQEGAIEQAIKRGNLLMKARGGHTIPRPGNHKDLVYDSVDEMIDEAVTYRARKNLRADLEGFADDTKNPDQFSWALTQLAEIQYADPKVFSDIASTGLPRQTLERAVAFIKNDPESMDAASAGAANALVIMKQDEFWASSIRRLVMERLLNATRSGSELRRAIFEDAEPTLGGDTTLKDLVYYKIAKGSYPELATKDYLLSRTDMTTSIPVEERNAGHFTEIREVLEAGYKSGAGDFIGKSLELTRYVLQGIDKKHGAATKASFLDTYVTEVIQKQGTSSVTLMLELANKLTPQLRAQFKQNEAAMPLLKTDGIGELPIALARIIQFGRIGESKSAPDAPEDVIDVAIDCAIMLADIGVENKLNQHVLSLGDFVMRHSRGRSAKEVRDLYEQTMRGDGQKSVSGLYRIKPRDKKLKGVAKAS